MQSLGALLLAGDDGQRSVTSLLMSLADHNSTMHTCDDLEERGKRNKRRRQAGTASRAPSSSSSRKRQRKDTQQKHETQNAASGAAARTGNTSSAAQMTATSCSSSSPQHHRHQNHPACVHKQPAQRSKRAGNRKQSTTRQEHQHQHTTRYRSGPYLDVPRIIRKSEDEENEDENEEENESESESEEANRSGRRTSGRPSSSSSSSFISRRDEGSSAVFRVVRAPQLAASTTAALAGNRLTEATTAMVTASPSLAGSGVPRTASFETVPVLHQGGASCADPFFELEGFFDYHYYAEPTAQAATSSTASPLPWSSSAPSSPLPSSVGNSSACPSRTSMTIPSPLSYSLFVAPSAQQQQLHQRGWTLPSRPSSPTPTFCSQYFSNL